MKRWAKAHILVLEATGFATFARVNDALAGLEADDVSNLDLIMVVDDGVVHQVFPTIASAVPTQ